MALTQEQIKSYREKYGIGGAVTPSTPETTQPVSNKVTEAVGLGGATNVFGRMANTLIAKYPNSPLSKLVGKNEGQKKVEELTGVPLEKSLDTFVEKPTGKEMVGATLQTAAIPAGIALTGGASVPTQMAVGAGLGYTYDVGQDLVEGKSTAQTITPGVATILGILGGATPLLAPAVGALKSPISKVLNKTTKAITETIPDSTLVQGAKQTATDLAERVPRFVGRVSEATKEQAIKAERLRTSTPAVAQAIKSELPESFIQTVPKANPATRQAFREVLDIADTPKTKLGEKANPAIVGGNYAAKQYDAIEKQRKLVGKLIGDEVEKLGKSNVKANMGVAFNQVDDVLVQNGFRIGKDGTLSSLKYTDKEMSVIQDLYNKSRKGGDVLTANEVRDIDNLFSKIQREARIDGVGDLRVKVNGEDYNLFRVFRDIYTNQLENIAPEIRPLNAKYRNLVTLTDDIEDSIFKTPNFNVTKNTDPAEFAKVNLRRIFGEAQSSPAYEAIADEMDAISRQLGYQGPTPKEVAAFAQEIRKLYPETIPSAGQQGIVTNAFDAVSQILGAGKADTRDQQKALRALLDESNVK